MKKRVERTRNGGTMTEAAFWGAIRSALRRMSRFWKPAMQCKAHYSRPYKGKNKRRKTEVQCQACKGWFPPSTIQMDHVVAVGSLYNRKGVATSASLWKFLERLFPEDMFAFQPLCKPCHKEKTNQERRTK